jgi:hypothetical protein
LSDAAEKAAGGYITAKVEIAYEAVSKVIETRGVACTRAQVEEIFKAVRPTLADMTAYALQHANSMGFGAGPGFGIAMDDAFRLNSETAIETLSLLADRAQSESSSASRPGDADSPIDLSSLVTDEGMNKHLHALWREAAQCYEAGANIATVVMLGSFLEGILLAKERLINQLSPDAGEAYSRRTLGELVTMALENGWIHQTRYGFSDVLRNYRNFVHPQKAASAGHTLDKGTATICMHVVREVLRDLGVVGAPRSDPYG